MGAGDCLCRIDRPDFAAIRHGYRHARLCQNDEVTIGRIIGRVNIIGKYGIGGNVISIYRSGGPAIGEGINNSAAERNRNSLNDIIYWIARGAVNDNMNAAGRKCIAIIGYLNPRVNHCAFRNDTDRVKNCIYPDIAFRIEKPTGEYTAPRINTNRDSI